jgi:HD-GYP domain-containing protein (c-di-GMP phosphodiesterase class II)
VSPAPTGGPNPPERIRLAELLAALSLVTDLARGHQPEEAMRACLLATRLAERMGMRDADRSVVYYTTLLRFVGCTATSHEYARVFGGDDVAVRSRGDLADVTVPREALSMLVGVTAREGTLAERGRRLAVALPRAKRAGIEGARADCEVGARMARRFGLDPEVPAALDDIFERWDGKGAPRRKRGEAIALPARLAAVAFTAVMFGGAGGTEAAMEAVRRWSGRALDPSIAAAFLAEAPDLLEAGDPADAWVAVVEAEPEPGERVSDRQFDEVARGFADVVDLKSPYLHGHSEGVAALAESAAGQAGLAEADVVMLRRAALLHDLGRVGIATGIWEKPEKLTTSEWEQVRLHPYHTERILGRAPALAPVARLAGLHHERLDGSGYHRGAPPAMLDTPSRILAAADAYHALTEDRPHRPAFDPPTAARTLEGLPLDREAVGAVLEAAGQRRRAGRSIHPAGLTEREVEVLRLVVQGRPEKQIARALHISPATVHTHVVHIYEKAGVSTRAGAAVFAMENDLVRP